MTCPALAARPLIDGHRRRVTYLRVSVTDRCDLRCTYCMSEEMTFLPRRDLLTLEELDRLCSAFVERGVRRIRLTGGEPLVRRDVVRLLESLSRHLAAILGRAHGRQMGAADRRTWIDAVRAPGPGPDAPGWLWSVVTDLMGAHQRGYLEHCRRIAREARDAA